MKCGRANMKTIKNLIGKICTFPNAIKAYMKARKCKRLRPEVLEFEQNREDNLQKAIDAIQSGEYTPGKYRIFKVWEPKERIIMALPFFDRVIQHMIVNIIEPIFEKRFIFHSYACRKGKGAHEASDTLSKWLYELEVVQGKKIYAIKGDIHHYFQSVAHDVLKKEIRRYISDKALLKILDRIIDHNGIFPPGVGIPVGNLTSQLFANVYLNKLDQYVKTHPENEILCSLYGRFYNIIRGSGRVAARSGTDRRISSPGIKTGTEPEDNDPCSKERNKLRRVYSFQRSQEGKKGRHAAPKEIIKSLRHRRSRTGRLRSFDRKPVRPHETRRQLYSDRGNEGESKRNQGKEGDGLKTGQKLPPFPFIIFTEERW